MSVPCRSRGAAFALFFGTGLVLAALDLWTKDAVFRFLNVVSVGSPPHVLQPVRHDVIPGWFQLEANYNYGAFSGWWSEHTGVLAALSATALIVIAAIFLHHTRKAHPHRWFIFALGLVWGGTLGNLYDRYFLRAVRDWIKWFYIDSSGVEHIWPNFNVADSAICTGVGLLVLLELLQGKKKTAEATPPSRQ